MDRDYTAGKRESTENPGAWRGWEFFTICAQIELRNREVTRRDAFPNRPSGEEGPLSLLKKVTLPYKQGEAGEVIHLKTPQGV
jgi:hypothetical protein